MARWLAGIAAVLLLITGTVVALQGRAEEPQTPPAPQARMAAPGRLAPIGAAPSADPKSKEEKRFARADINEDGRITLAELVEPRRKAFAKLDLDQDGKLSFEEWAVRTIDKFEEADGDKSKSLTPAEYAATAPKPRPKPAACACG
jgi:EF hand